MDILGQKRLSSQQKFSCRQVRSLPNRGTLVALVRSQVAVQPDRKLDIGVCQQFSIGLELMKMAAGDNRRRCRRRRWNVSVGREELIDPDHCTVSFTILLMFNMTNFAHISTEIQDVKFDI